MVVHVFDTPAQVAQAAAAVIAAQVLQKPDSVLGLATGSTPMDTYRELISLHRGGVLDFSRVKSYNLDEYVGLPDGHPESYVSFMKRNLFDHINIGSYSLPDGRARDLQRECESYEQAIKDDGGIDLQLLGIGRNGHIGFNEPASSLVSRTRLVALTQQTISDNARFFDAADEVPRHAISMGIGTILEAKRCIMLCFGEHKAKAVRAAIEGGVSQFTPASALQMHPDTTVFLDEAAAADLDLKEYYRWSAANQPA